MSPSIPVWFYSKTQTEPGMEGKCIIVDGYIDRCMYLSLDHPRPLQPQVSDCMEHIHHSLSLEPLNQNTHCNVGPSTTTPTTATQ